MFRRLLTGGLLAGIGLAAHLLLRLDRAALPAGTAATATSTRHLGTSG
jgi:hypothetical protein